MAAAAAVGVAVVLAAVVCLPRRARPAPWAGRQRAASPGGGDRARLRPLEQPLPGIPPSAGGPAPYVQVVLADGTMLPIVGDLSLPVNSHVPSVAAGGAART